MATTWPMVRGRSSTAIANNPTTSCSMAWTTTRCRTTCLATRLRPTQSRNSISSRTTPQPNSATFMGGIVSVTIKSGTNGFHGDVWEFFRNDKLNANQWENKINPTRRRSRALQFAGTCLAAHSADRSLRTSCSSSLTIRDSDSITHRPGASSRSSRLPSRRAIFSALLNQSTPIQLYNPCAGTTGQNGTACVAATTRTPFAGNIIPASMISPVAAALFASPLYPKTINSNLTNNALQLTSQAYNSDQGDVKVDYRLSSKDMISGRFTRAFQIDPTTRSQLLFGNGVATAPIWSAVGDWTRSFKRTSSTTLASAGITSLSIREPRLIRRSGLLANRWESRAPIQPELSASGLDSVEERPQPG